MATTFLFEELDDATREYLMAVRDAEGSGSPGVFAPTNDSLPGCGCIAGPVVIIATLLLTIPTWTGIVFDSPPRVAILQTAGLLVGGWLLVAGFRGKGGSKNAGTWVYVDSLHMYEAYREQVTVTNIEDVSDAHYTHNYDSNGNHQNSVINIALGGRKTTTVTLNNEKRAEQVVTYLNYLAWARGPDGGDRADLAPDDLGALARYVVRNGDEPKDAENNINLSVVELDITGVPERPAREGRAIPSFLPYVVMFAAGLVCFLFFGFVLNPIVRDDAIFERVTGDGPREQPGALRAYLIDSRNTRHRAEVVKRLPKFYAPAIKHVQDKATNQDLGKGMGEILTVLSTAEQPVVSLRVTETQSPPGGAGDAKTTRQTKLGTEFADGVGNAFSLEGWGRQVPPPPEYTWNSPTDPPPIGQQLMAFVEAPDDNKPVHFDIEYEVKDAPGVAGMYRVEVSVKLRSDVEKGDVTSARFVVPAPFSAADFADDAQGSIPAVRKIKDELIRQIVGPLPGAAP